MSRLAAACRSWSCLRTRRLKSIAVWVPLLEDIEGAWLRQAPKVVADMVIDVLSWDA